MDNSGKNAGSQKQRADIDKATGSTHSPLPHR
jgi:hypothetical protein